MINHAITLLLNAPGPQRSILPPEFYRGPFQPVDPGPFQPVADILLGVSGDNAGRLARVWNYVTLLHTPPYDAYVLQPDARITYQPDHVVDLADVPYGPVVQGDAGLLVSGHGTEQDGRQLQAYRITCDGTDVSITNLTSGVALQQSAASHIVLPGAPELSCTLQDPSKVRSWFINYRRYPRDCAAILQELDGMKESDQVQLFGSTNLQEPYRTFYNMAKTSQLLTLRLNGYLLAYIYRLEATRTRA